MNIGTNERPTRKAYVLRPHPELSSVIRQPNRHALTLFHDLGEASRHALRALLYRLKDSTISRGKSLAVLPSCRGHPVQASARDCGSGAAVAAVDCVCIGSLAVV